MTLGSMKLKAAWLAPLSGLLLLLAFSPFDLRPLVFLALWPFVYGLSQPEVRPFRFGYSFGLVYGLGQFLFTAQLTFRWTHSTFLALVPYLIATALYAIYFGVAGWLIQRCWQLGLPWLIPLVWAGIEVFRSFIPVLAFPWGLVASPLWRYSWLIQSAHYITIFGVGALVVLVNTALAVFALKRPAQGRKMLLTALSVAAVPLAGRLIPSHVRWVRATAGQLGLDLAFTEESRQAHGISVNVQELEDEARRSGSVLLILPEGLIRAGAELPPKTPFPIPDDLALVFGGQREIGNYTYQSAYAVDKQWSVADKTRLVIFGEFVPRWIPFLGAFNLPTGDLTPGNTVRPVSAAGLTVGPMLCFEELFPDVSYRQAVGGAQVLAVMSMDDWFMGSTAPDQLAAGAVWRAVETGLPMIRSTTTGYTLVCDGYGDILGEAPLHELASVTCQVPVRDSMPAWWLPVFPLLSLASCGLAAFLRGNRSK